MKQKGHACRQAGFSLLEIIVVISLFTGIVIFANQALFSTLKGNTKSQVSTKIKQASSYAFDLMERELRQSTAVGTCTPTSITYTKIDGAQSSFVCNTGTTGYLSFGGVKITPDDVAVTACNFSCTVLGSSRTVSLDVTFAQTGNSTSLRVEETDKYQLKNQILLRN
ncbi:MAG: hypothetical protein A3A58_02450 [Candidatus Blackburnbacteria bacterium RIFCSPLOWO2_01_FULL_41_27]|uniref:Type II secretion system protein GspH n=2 Tax=Candidatus Blackburniibacteriota TaxID=1817898 RepID=A0A1G1V434_9BACT|nr:MAG: hypothetical protein A3F61_02150 [Candidatus Blackburnbacteria bacterium RIFCSPHIGHO2_12_FULL_41_13b]OGY14758.1 MAG: hypothetical protein A3A58_02450 [Candidatus Blackburnbacteria bacterium RIFCSPLOWO2_01_FULL_41_27]